MAGRGTGDLVTGGSKPERRRRLIGRRAEDKIRRVSGPGRGPPASASASSALALHDCPRLRRDPAALPGKHPSLGRRDGHRRHRLEDETPQIAEEFGGAARSISRGATIFRPHETSRCGTRRGEWLFWMDSDDTIPPGCGRQLRELVDREVDPNMLGYVMQVHCPGADGEGGRMADVTVVDHIKLIRNRPDLRFDGRIHEQVLPAIRRAGGTVAWTGLYVVHSGSDPSPERRTQAQRDLHLLHLELRERPQHPFTLFNLGMTYVDGGRYEEAEGFLRRSLKHSSPDESHLRKVYALLVCAQTQLGRRDERSGHMSRGKGAFPEDAELRFREGMLLTRAGPFGGGGGGVPRCPRQSRCAALQQRRSRHYRLQGAPEPGATVYTDMGDLERAEEEWREVLRAMPGYRPAWRGLSEVLMCAGRYQEVQAVAEQCLNNGALWRRGASHPRAARDGEG